MKVIIQRYKSDENQTTGTLTVVDDNGWPVFTCPCIERGDRNNQRNNSSIPPGSYPLVLEYSPRFNMDLFEIKDVPGRSECKIHSSNFWHELEGCIAPGAYLKNLDGDKYLDVAASRRALNDFHRVMGDVTVTTILILNPYNYSPIPS